VNFPAKVEKTYFDGQSIDIFAKEQVVSIYRHGE
jgi:hypothetical protein